MLLLMSVKKKNSSAFDFFGKAVIDSLVQRFEMSGKERRARETSSTKAPKKKQKQASTSQSIPQGQHSSQEPQTIPPWQFPQPPPWMFAQGQQFPYPGFTMYPPMNPWMFQNQQSIAPPQNQQSITPPQNQQSIAPPQNQQLIAPPQNQQLIAPPQNQQFGNSFQNQQSRDPSPCTQSSSHIQSSSHTQTPSETSNLHESPASSHSSPQSSQERVEICETSTKKLITPDGKTGFSPHKEVCKTILTIIKSNFKGPYQCWRDVPPDVRKLWWTEFQKSYAWLPEHNEQIHHNFVSRVTQRVKDLIHHACAKRKKRPVWVKESIWEQLCARRSTIEFSQLSEKMKKNRASTSSQFGSSLHCGGSISALEHAKRLKKELGREPTAPEIFLRMHQRKDGSWVDKKSEAIYAKFLKLQSNYNSEVGGSSEQPSELTLWLQATGGKKKGLVYGLGAESHKVVGSSTAGFAIESDSHKSWVHSSVIQKVVQSEVVQELTIAHEKKVAEFQRQLEQTNSQISSLQQKFDAFQKSFSSQMSQLTQLLGNVVPSAQVSSLSKLNVNVVEEEANNDDNV